MKDMIKRIREERDGFTLAELLIVVAIIAVPVAIAIPIFNAQLEKSRDAVTVSNLRAAYAEAQTAVIGGADSGNATITKNQDGTKSVTVKGVAAKGEQAGYSDDVDKELPFDAPAEMGGTAGNYDVTFSYDKDGGITGVACSKK